MWEISRGSVKHQNYSKFENVFRSKLPMYIFVEKYVRQENCLFSPCWICILIIKTDWLLPRMNTHQQYCVYTSTLPYYFSFNLVTKCDLIKERVSKILQETFEASNYGFVIFYTLFLACFAWGNGRERVKVCCLVGIWDDLILLKLHNIVSV